MKNARSLLVALALAATTLAGSARAHADVLAALDTRAPAQLAPQWGNDWVAAQVASAAYLDDEAHRWHALAVSGLYEIDFLRGPLDTQVTLAEDKSGKFLFIGVRGTQSEPVDILTDARLARQGTAWSEGGRVHVGFAGSADGVLASVKAAAKGAIDDGRQVILTGHSLGGAVASILAFRLEKAGVHVHSVITFGMPASGDATWAHRYDLALGDRTFPFHNHNDPVPCVPLDGDAWTRLQGERSFHLYDSGYAFEKVECVREPSIREIVFKVVDHIGADVLASIPGGTNLAAAVKAGTQGLHRLVRTVCSMDDALPGWLQTLIEFGTPCERDLGELLEKAVLTIIPFFSRFSFSDHSLGMYISYLGIAIDRAGAGGDLFTRPRSMQRLNEIGQGDGAGTPAGVEIDRDSIADGTTTAQVDRTSSDPETYALFAYDKYSGVLKVTTVLTTGFGSVRFNRDIGDGWNDVRHFWSGGHEYLAVVSDTGDTKILSYRDSASFVPAVVQTVTDHVPVLRRRPTTCDPDASTVHDMSDMPALDPSCQKYLCLQGGADEILPGGSYRYDCEVPPDSAWVPCAEESTFNPNGGYDPRVCLMKYPFMERVRTFEAGGDMHLLLYNRNGTGFTYDLGADGKASHKSGFTIEHGFTTLETYQAGGKTFLFALRENDGVAKVYELDANGHINVHARFSYDWTSGWSGATFYSVGTPGHAEGTQQFLLLMKENDGVVNVERVKSDGSVNELVWHRDNWTTGWTSVGAIRQNVQICVANPWNVGCTITIQTVLVTVKE